MLDGGQEPLDEYSRREYLGGITGLLAAAAFSRSVSAETAAPVTTEGRPGTQTVASPDGSLSVTVDVADGVPSYSLRHEDTTLIEDATLGFEFQNQAPFGRGIEVTGTEHRPVHRRGREPLQRLRQRAGVLAPDVRLLASRPEQERRVDQSRRSRGQCHLR